MPIAVAALPSKKSFSEIANLEGYTPCLPGAVKLLTTLVAKGDAKLGGKAPAEDDLIVYNGEEPAPLSVQDYMIRLFKYGLASAEAYIHMVVYMGRFRSRLACEFHSYNIHRLMLTAFTVAAKLRDDVYYSNAFYAKIGGIAVEDLNRMEQEFLTDCDWELFVTEEEHAAFSQALLSASEGTNGAAAPAPPAKPAAKSPLAAVKKVKANVLMSLKRLGTRNSAGGSSSRSLCQGMSSECVSEAH